MDSINQNQTECNHENLNAAIAVEKLKEIVDKAKSCFFTTSVDSGFRTRPMNVQEVDDEGNLWFLSADDSHKNLELKDNPFVQLYFQGSPHSDFLSLEGKATISRDKQRIKDLWQFVIGTWFTEGVDDPRITVIKVTPIEGYYWDNKHGNTIAGIKMLFGAMIQKTMDDSIEGELQFTHGSVKSD